MASGSAAAPSRCALSGDSVLNQGLVKFANEAELDQKAHAAYRAYRHDKYPAWNLQYPFRLARFWLDKLFIPHASGRSMQSNLWAYGTRLPCLWIANR